MMFGVRTTGTSPAARRIDAAGRAFAAAKAAPRRVPRFAWSDDEVATLRLYACRGMPVLRRYLPKRTKAAINNKAHDLGVSIRRARRKGYKVAAMRGRITVPAHVHPLVRRFFAAMKEARATFAEMDKAIGLGSGTVAGWTRARTPRLDTFIAALNAVGLDLRLVERARTDPSLFLAGGPLLDILARTAWRHGVTAEEIVAHVRTPGAVLLARDEAYWLARRHLRMPVTEIGRHMGGRDQSSVRVGIARHQARIDAARARRAAR